MLQTESSFLPRVTSDKSRPPQHNLYACIFGISDLCCRYSSVPRNNCSCNTNDFCAVNISLSCNKHYNLKSIGLYNEHHVKTYFTFITLAIVFLSNIGIESKTPDESQRNVNITIIQMATCLFTFLSYNEIIK